MLSLWSVKFKTLINLVNFNFEYWKVNIIQTSSSHDQNILPVQNIANY